MTDETAARTIEKQYARRNISGYRSPYADPFEYRSIVTVGIDEVFKLMAPSVENKSNADSLAQAKIEFEEFVRFAGPFYLPENWLVAFKDGEAVGYVFPQQYWDKPEEGSIFSIAVLPELRDRGYGKIIHAKGLEVLAESGVESYVGSTEITNRAMIATFLANGCTLSKIHRIEVDESGNHLRFLT